MTLTGRIAQTPSALWNEEVLAPQFAYEAEHLLRHYVAIEKVLLLEYRRMGLVDAAGAAGLAARLDSVTSDGLRADPEANMSDISFALERHVASGPVEPFAAWHVDRSRNDLQVCAQLMAARALVRDAAAQLLAFGRTVASLASSTAAMPMPGYTHNQAAQIITPGYYLAALSAEILAASRRLLSTYDEIDASPLGSGAMAGQELEWDRERMAVLLGFRAAQPHALVGVASRGWVLAIANAVSEFGVVLSRFTTDLMTWGGSGFGFIALPDSLSGISAAMPQKRNYPVLERIRGRSSHLTAFAVDIALGQRNTPYTNSVEVSKEAGTHLRTLMDALGSTLRLAGAVVRNLSFEEARMREACEGEYLGGFSLANGMTLTESVPWRTSQVIAGRYVAAAVAADLAPKDQDAAMLAGIAAEVGFPLQRPGELLAEAFDVDRGLRAKRSAGSAHPDRVLEVLGDQAAEFERLEGAWGERNAMIEAAAALVALELADDGTGR